MGDVLGSPEMVEALFNRFSPTLSEHLGTFGSATQETPGFRMYLCRDSGSSDALGAHVDSLRKLLTIVNSFRSESTWAPSRSEEPESLHRYIRKPGASCVAEPNVTRCSLSVGETRLNRASTISGLPSTSPI